MQKDALITRFEDIGERILISESNNPEMTAQEIFSRLHYNRLYVSKSVTDSVEGFYYKHQTLVSRYLFMNDSLLVIHEPGTGKTITQLYAMMRLLQARVIVRIIMINNSEMGNRVALKTLAKIYADTFEGYFRMTFNRFSSKFVQHFTLSKLSKKSYGSNVGIIIDEAHNILSDNESRMPKKLEDMAYFIEIISKYKGIKMILSTATPIFGDVNSLGGMRSLLYRNRNELVPSLPQSMVSYTKINYNHLKAIQVINPEYPDHGNLSFTMINNKEYLFYAYVTKPKPMQIADFASLAISNLPSQFQGHIKPLIVQSTKYGERTQSAILDAIIELIEATKDGTVIIYTDLKQKGAIAIGQYLELRGYEKYSKRGSKERIKQNKPSDSVNVQNKQLTSKLAKINSDIQKLEVHLMGTSESYLQTLETQLLNIRNEPPNVVNGFRAYVQNYRINYKKDTEAKKEISELQKQKDLLINKIEEIKAIRAGNKKSTDSKKFIIYSSGMFAEEKQAFEIFNSEKNWDGSLIKVIIGSRVMRDGVDIKHVVQTHIVIPEWRIPGIVQAEHRGFRSNSHDVLIHERAIGEVRKQLRDSSITKKITYEEARKPIEVEIFHHYMDFDLLTIEDINEARQYFSSELLEKSDEEILKIMKSPDNPHKAGEAIYRAAIEHHITVGAKMMELRSSAIDYKLNVRLTDRIEDAVTEEEAEEQRKELELLSVKDTELFYMNDYIDSIITEIVKVLLEESCVDTDNLVEYLLELNPILSQELIATAIIELTRYRKFVYNSILGIDMIVMLYETDEESILYLSTDENNTSHPYNAHVQNIGITLATRTQRPSTKIKQEDLKIPKAPQTFYKLKDLVRKAMRGEEILTQVEYTFLIQMSNYWAFSWKDLLNPALDKNHTSVYVFERHITKPSINILAKDLLVHEYRVSEDKWKSATSLNIKNTFFVRYVSLVELYRNFAFYRLPEFGQHPKFVDMIEYPDINGIIFIKGYYNPNPNGQSFTDKLLDSDNVLLEPIAKNVLVKKFANQTSKGSQISMNLPQQQHNNRDFIKQYLSCISSDDISLFVFLYDIDESVRRGNPDIFEIKRKELTTMMQAVNGTPTLRFQIQAIEDMIKDSERKKEIYKMVYKLPIFIAE